MVCSGVRVRWAPPALSLRLLRDFDQVFATDTARIPTDALNNYGLWLTYLDRMQEASTVYREVLHRDPGWTPLLSTTWRSLRFLTTVYRLHKTR